MSINITRNKIGINGVDVWRGKWKFIVRCSHPPLKASNLVISRCRQDESGKETHQSVKAAKCEIQKPSTCRATLFRCKFWSMFRVFHLAWSTWPATKTIVAGWRNVARWLVDLLVHGRICWATSCELDEKRATKPKFVAQSRPALYFSQQLSSTRNKCFCCATRWLCKVKNGKHRPKLATKQCWPPIWGFLYLVFSRLKTYVQRVQNHCFCSSVKPNVPCRFRSLRCPPCLSSILREEEILGLWTNHSY